MKKILFRIMIFFIFIFLFSCDKNNSAKKTVINLPQTQTPVELSQWGVTKYASLPIRSEPRDDADRIRSLPLAAIVELIKKDKELKNFENTVDYWYYLDYKSLNGWIFGSYIEIFNSYDEAEKRSEEILFGTKKQ